MSKNEDLNSSANINSSSLINKTLDKETKLKHQTIGNEAGEDEFTSIREPGIVETIAINDYKQRNQKYVIIKEGDKETKHQSKLNAESSEQEIRRIESFLLKRTKKTAKQRTIFCVRECSSDSLSADKNQNYWQKVSGNISQFWNVHVRRRKVQSRISRRVRPTSSENRLLNILENNPEPSLCNPCARRWRRLRHHMAHLARICVFRQPTVDSNVRREQEHSMSNRQNNRIQHYHSNRTHVQRSPVANVCGPVRIRQCQPSSLYESLQQILGGAGCRLPIMNEADIALHLFHPLHVCPLPHMSHCRPKSAPSRC